VVKKKSRRKLAILKGASRLATTLIQLANEIAPFRVCSFTQLHQLLPVIEPVESIGNCARLCVCVCRCVRCVGCVRCLAIFCIAFLFTSIITVSEQFQCSFRAVLEQFQSSFNE